MAKRQFQLNETEVRDLQIAYENCKNGPARTRLQAVRLYGTGYSTRDITAITGVERRLLLRWCAKYRRGGVTALQDQRQGGNRRRLTATQLAEVRTKLHQYRPIDELDRGRVATADGLHWTVPDLRQALDMWYGLTYKADGTYRTLFKKSGFSLQHPRKHYRSRSEDKLAAFEEQLEKN